MLPMSENIPWLHSPPPDMPSKTVTGTIAINVEDSNDNCPMLVTTYQHACSDTKVVYISAFDEDDSANPLSFRLIQEESQGAWEVKPVDGKSNISLGSANILWG